MSQIMVLGAGMVGVSSALALQARGHQVTLVDRRGPGRETSFGNAGFIQAEAVEPYAIPRDLRTLLSYATGRSNDIVYDPAQLPRIAKVLLAYWRNSAPARHRAIAATYARLAQRSTADHQPLIAASGQDNLIRRTGYAQVFRDGSVFDGAAREAERLKAEYGVRVTAKDAATFASAEPGVKRPVAGALAWDDTWTCADPGALTAGYADLFTRQGGRFVDGDALSLTQSATGWQIDSAEGPVEAEQVVVALGPWGPDLLKRFGYRVPMLWKRGYHGHFDSPTPLSRPVMDAQNGIVMTPTTRGLRLATGAALVDREAPAEPRQLERGAKAVSDLVDLGPRVQEVQWFGHRPCLPDMLPLVGQAPRHPTLWLNFGHGHQGFTLGPTTALLLADAMDGQRDDLATALAPASRPAAIH
ncbi:FAD-binding oxidoreductase [Pseudooceanicola sp. CBS1P-1]|uniref:FAD-dependent oxidoreductase n=1 Tax=Pseudooceanicola albus TaxID=2692189 RepID=A0A6L7G643_9RHOB|nr:MULTISPECIES: FAD-dependent oxidoreductase [Pseudooceanicola]MBT9385341.1 FAD-binding oxidoreductase [Pseudooceanicola endophyticus]MXN18800.1 FAD-dependent oxidoreductase [Pseudooceanicola albus]